MIKNSTFQTKILKTDVPGQKTENKAKLTQQSAGKSKRENQELDGAELFSRFTADIIKQKVLFTR